MSDDDDVSARDTHEWPTVLSVIVRDSSRALAREALRHAAIVSMTTRQQRRVMFARWRFERGQLTDWPLASHG